MDNQTLAHQIVGATLLVVLLAGCAAQPPATPVPESPSATSTPKPIPPTSTPKPPTATATPTAIPVVATYPLVPRYMLPSAPYYSTEILGTSCSYQQDDWNTQSAYIAYACPDLDVLRLSIRFTNLEDGQTVQDLFGEFPPDGHVVIAPGDLQSQYKNLSLFGRAENDKYSYFMVYETGDFVISSEVFFPEDTTISLEEFYTENSETVLNAVLEIMLEKVMSEGTRSEPTPVAVDQQELYNQIAPWLVTELEANEYYQDAPDMFGDPFDGTWVWQGDEVNAQWKLVCRKFADRTNEDAPLVAFGNCVYIRPNYNLNDLQESFQSAVILKSTFDYPDQSIIYGGDMPNGHTSLNAYILQDDYLFYVWVDSRTLSGQKPEDVFQGFDDGFIYNVIKTNLERYDSESTDYSESQEEGDSNDPFIGTWVSIDPGDGSNQQLSISKNNNIYKVNYYDDVAGSCGLDNAGKTIEASGSSTGFVKGNVLSTDIPVWCLTDPRSLIGTFHVEYTYNQSDDTLADSFEVQVIWSRP